MELIDKTVVLASIEEDIKEYSKVKKEHHNCEYFDGALAILEDFRDEFLEALETKDVDLDFQTFAKEMDAVFALPSTETKNTEEDPLNWEYAIAKHFFELGLKTWRVRNEQG